MDGTGRVQTVDRDVTLAITGSSSGSRTLTGVPVVLNTSFNENEPIVRTPAEAVETFLRTKMDVLVLGNYVVRRDGTS